MANKKNKTGQKELYLKVPYHILCNNKIGPREQLLLAHIHSFGRKGCWQSNETLGKMFNIGERTVSRKVKELKKAGCIFWVHPKGRYRTIWAKSHPDVKAAQSLLYMGNEINKKAIITGQAKHILLRQNCQGGIDKTDVPTATKQCIQVRQNCLHTNNTTIKDTTVETIATPSPLPAGGQAPALLAEKKKAVQKDVEQFKANFGKPKGRTSPKLTEQEFEDKRQAQIRQLMID
ncbi:MAG: helix-turn-helix domain-containing protein [Phycisphaerales bacterium]|jgi:biotin operon repressor